jgi:hypothetical protein
VFHYYGLLIRKREYIEFETLKKQCWSYVRNIKTAINYFIYLLSYKLLSYLEAKRREAAAEISKRMGQDMIVYNSIRASDHRSTMASDLLGGSKRMIALPPGVVEIGDGRILSGGLKVDIAERKIISTSFDADWRCIACNHPSDHPAFKFIGCADSQNTPHAIILGDQAVPAVLPSGTEKQCIKVLIIENGSLRELADELLKLIGNRRVL